MENARVGRVGKRPPPSAGRCWGERRRRGGRGWWEAGEKQDGGRSFSRCREKRNGGVTETGLKNGEPAGESDRPDRGDV